MREGVKQEGIKETDLERCGVCFNSPDLGPKVFLHNSEVCSKT